MPVSFLNTVSNKLGDVYWMILILLYAHPYTPPESLKYLSFDNKFWPVLFDVSFWFYTECVGQLAGATSERDWIGEREICQNSYISNV